MQRSWPVIQASVIIFVIIVALNMSQKLKITVLDKESYAKAKEYFAHFKNFNEEGSENVSDNKEEAKNENVDQNKK